jgi:putative Ca2+/H+ antiporter (TMEM165/GDT1 family)
MMDYRIILTTFLTVFFAELGDKTQLATLVISSVSNSKLSVFIGSALALASASFIAVVLGDYVGEYLNQKILYKISSVSFFLMGSYYLYKGFIENN